MRGESWIQRFVGSGTEMLVVGKKRASLFSGVVGGDGVAEVVCDWMFCFVLFDWCRRI